MHWGAQLAELLRDSGGEIGPVEGGQASDDMAFNAEDKYDWLSDVVVLRLRLSMIVREHSRLRRIGLLRSVPPICGQLRRGERWKPGRARPAAHTNLDQC